MWFDTLIQQMRASDRMLACHAMRNHLSKNSAEQKLTCICAEAPSSSINSSVITGLLCALTACSVCWAIVATWKPSWLKILKEKSVNLFARFLCKSKDCHPETGVPSDQPPTSQEPAVTNNQEPDTNINPKDPAAPIALKVRRPRARVCPYRRSEGQLRRKIKEETFDDLRRLIRMAKIEAKAEVEEEMKNFEASAPELDPTTLFDDH